MRLIIKISLIVAGFLILLPTYSAGSAELGKCICGPLGSTQSFEYQDSSCKAYTGSGTCAFYPYVADAQPMVQLGVCQCGLEPPYKAYQNQTASCIIRGESKCVFYPYKNLCCCVEGGDCIKKQFVDVGGTPRVSCGPDDFGYSNFNSPQGFQYYNRPLPSSGECKDAEDPPAVCICKTKDKGYPRCKEGLTISAIGGVQQRITCANKSEDPHSCKNYCASLGDDWNYLDCDLGPDYIKVDQARKAPINLENGCAPTHCWCKNDKGYCTHDTDAGGGRSFGTQASCDEFCKAQNTGGRTGWKTLKWEPTYVDYYKITDAAGGCWFADREPAKLTYDFTENIRRDAQKLNQLTRFRGVAEFIGNGIRVMLMFIGSITLVMYIYGGLLWMTASGNTEQIGKAKQILVYATIGVIAMLSSFLLVQFLFGTLLQLRA